MNVSQPTQTELVKLWYTNGRSAVSALEYELKEIDE